jgi:hypothetical protein
MRDFIAHHDERWLFVVVYIGLAVVLSVMLSLFWLVAVAGLHLGLEYLRQAQHYQTRSDIMTHALWEIRLDLALVLLALAMAVYMNVVLGLLGLQSAARATAAARAGARVTRIAAWQRNIRAFVLMADDAFRVVQIAVTRFFRREPAAAALAVARETGSQAAASADLPSAGRAGATGTSSPDGGHVPSRPPRIDAATDAPSTVIRSWRDAWTWGDRATVALGAGCTALIVLAPFFTPHDWTAVTLTLLEQLHPFPPK